ncbi:CBS domain-containing protein [Natronosporangium hydrolyticum]|uniref:CBS domain-containing protein n=1 Tax=Natronosporangium hydrolyticum TaxID=2811111 RepID=A0A895YMM6_9ACTN|nr:CBS domain-containing protein [Natronosporangium hydrolyticum]QSB15158.1 CBS domain-containing protein [Natronosporangium hydrolyticum]
MRTWLVDDVMTTGVATVTADTPYREIADTLVARRVSAVPVLDAEGRVVGVVSATDLMYKVEYGGAEEGHHHHLLAGPRQRQARTKARGGVARQLMSTPAVTIGAGASLSVAARLMDTESVKRLPVTDSDGRLVGVVARSDLLRVYLRPDAEIERDVAEEVLRRTLWVEPDTIRVRSRNGVVTLTGRVDRFSTQQLAVKLTSAVPGVVEVVDRLGFDFDDRRVAAPPVYAAGPFGHP